ncbi:DMT family transporter [Novosphingobium tardum]|uniref:DMT family transporter n=1 Tax=Novosphingobium tardum TaxID=1538021 RepID=A0ABV8RMS3_9SPHN
MSRHSPILPIFSALAGIALFGVMDGVMKAAGGALGVWSTLFWRSCIAVLLMFPLWRLGGGRWPARATLRLHLLRGAVATAMALLFFWGLVRTPMADAIGISFIAPLLALYLAAVMLGERIEGKAIAASLLGLAGVLVIVLGKLGREAATGQAADEASWGIAAILGSAVLYAWNLILQRRQAQVAGPREIALFQNMVVLGLLGCGSPWMVAVPPPAAWLLIGAAAALGVVSLMLMSWAYGRAEAQVLVPVEYSAFVWAAIIGWLAYAEQVTAFTVAGVALIVGGCLVAARRSPIEQVAL